MLHDGDRWIKTTQTPVRTELLSQECTTVLKNKSGTCLCHDRNTKASQSALTKAEQRWLYSIMSPLENGYFCISALRSFFSRNASVSGDRRLWQSKQGAWIKCDRLSKELQESVVCDSGTDMQLLSKHFLTPAEKKLHNLHLPPGIRTLLLHFKIW